MCVCFLFDRWSLQLKDTEEHHGKASHLNPPFLYIDLNLGLLKSFPTVVNLSFFYTHINFMLLLPIQSTSYYFFLPTCSSQNLKQWCNWTSLLCLQLEAETIGLFLPITFLISSSSLQLLPLTWPIRNISILSTSSLCRYYIKDTKNWQVFCCG